MPAGLPGSQPLPRSRTLGCNQIVVLAMASSRPHLFMKRPSYSLLPAGTTALDPRELEYIFRVWIIRCFRDYVCDCLHVAEYPLAVSALRPTANILHPASFAPADIASLLRLTFATCVGVRDGPVAEERVELLYTGTRERELALRALNDLITDMDFLEVARRDPFLTTAEMLEHARGIAWIGVEQVLIAGELLSPAVVLFEKLKRDREVRAQLGRIERSNS